MTGVLLPPGQAAAFRAQQTAKFRAATASPAVNLTSDEFVTDDQIRAQVAKFKAECLRPPTPVGWGVSALMLSTPEMTDGGLHLIDEERERRQIVSPQGIVVALGAMAYRATNTDDLRFAESGPWCKVGDRILFQRYGGRAFRLANGQVLIRLNDTDVTDVIDGGWM